MWWLATRKLLSPGAIYKEVGRGRKVSRERKRKLVGNVPSHFGDNKTLVVKFGDGPPGSPFWGRGKGVP